MLELTIFVIVSLPIAAGSSPWSLYVDTHILLPKNMSKYLRENTDDTV